MNEEDCNSNFFHASTITRRRKNNIAEIKLENGNHIYEKEGIEKCFERHFKELYSSSNPNFPRDLENLISPFIEPEENKDLIHIPLLHETKQTVFDMNPLKSLGSDGMPGLFFKKFCSIVGEQVIKVVSSFFRDKRMLRELNHTYITLISKTQDACKFSQFRPISLCNFCYKVITRILVAKLRPILSMLIDPALVTFVPNRNIVENTLLAQEVVHTFSQTKKKQGYLGLKIDFQKAYDRMEWSFLA